MQHADPFERWRLAGTDDAGPEEVLAEAGRLLDLAELNGDAAWVELDAHFALGWHPDLGRFRVAARAEGAPADLPAWLAALEAARHVHAGGTSAEAAFEALLVLVRATEARLG